MYEKLCLSLRRQKKINFINEKEENFCFEIFHSNKEII